MNPLSAILICAIAYAIGDYVSNKTNAMLPMLFVSGFILLLGFWTVLPLTMLEDTGLFAVSLIVAPMFVVNTGTLMNFGEMISEYRTVIIAFFAVIVIALLLYFVGGYLIGQQFAVAAAGPISGGLVAVLIIQEAAAAANLEQIAVFVTVLFVLQLFVGLPIAAFCLSQDAKRLVGEYRSNELSHKPQQSNTPQAKKSRLQIFPDTPAEYKTPFILLMKILLVTWLALWCADLMGGVINKFIIALVFGVLFKELGFLEGKILDLASSTGFVLFILFILVYWYLPQATPGMMASMVKPVTISFTIAICAILAVSLLMSKLFSYSWRLCVALGISCFFGFPGTYTIPQEVAKAQGETLEEQEYLLNFYLPKMLVAGFTTVSVASVFIAGFMVKLL